MELIKSFQDSHCRIFFHNFCISLLVVYGIKKKRKIHSCGAVREHRRVNDMKSSKRLKKGKMDSRYYDGMSIVKWFDTKSMIMVSKIDNTNPIKKVNVIRQTKDQQGKIHVKVLEMEQKYNKYMKVTEPLDQKATVYAFDKKIPGKYHCRLFRDYTDMGLANSSIVYNKIIVSKFFSQRKDNIVKMQKYLKRMVGIELINDFISRKKNIYQGQRYRKTSKPNRICRKARMMQKMFLDREDRQKRLHKIL